MVMKRPWEAYNNDHGPLYRQFPTWGEAFEFVHKCTLLHAAANTPIPYVLV